MTAFRGLREAVQAFVMGFRSVPVAGRNGNESQDMRR